MEKKKQLKKKSKVKQRPKKKKQKKSIWEELQKENDAWDKLKEDYKKIFK